MQFHAPHLKADGKTQQVFETNVSNLSHLYTAADSCLSTSRFNACLYYAAIDRLPLVQSTAVRDSVLKCKSNLVDNCNPLVNLLRDADLLRSLHQQHRGTNADQPAILISGPLLRKKVADVASRLKDHSWYSAIGVLAIFGSGCKILMYDSSSIGPLEAWLNEYRRVVKAGGGSGTNAVQVPAMPIASKTYLLADTLVYVDHSYSQNADVLSFAFPDDAKPFHMLLMTPDQLGLVRTMPAAVDVDAPRKFNAHVLAGIYCLNTVEQKMLRSG